MVVHRFRRLVLLCACFEQNGLSVYTSARAPLRQPYQNPRFRNDSMPFSEVPFYRQNDRDSRHQFSVFLAPLIVPLTCRRLYQHFLFHSHRAA